MKDKLIRLQEEAKLAGLNINVNTTKEMRKNTQIEEEPSITNKEIEQVESFTYLGSIVTQDGGTDQDINQRIIKANAAYMQLYQVWKNRNLSKKTKLRIFNNNVKSFFLYACETWSVLKTSMNKLQTFVNMCLRRILNIRWPDTISNNSLWAITKDEPINIQIKKRKWRWIGHTLRKPAGAIDWNPQGARRRGRPRKTWRRAIEDEMTEMERPGDRSRHWQTGRKDGEASQEPYVPPGTKGIKSSQQVILHVYNIIISCPGV
jgi:hypothetical protein